MGLKSISTNTLETAFKRRPRLEYVTRSENNSTYYVNIKNSAFDDVLLLFYINSAKKIYIVSKTLYVYI